MLGTIRSIIRLNDNPRVTVSKLQKAVERHIASSGGKAGLSEYVPVRRISPLKLIRVIQKIRRFSSGPGRLFIDKSRNLSI